MLAKEFKKKGRVYKVQTFGTLQSSSSFNKKRTRHRSLNHLQAQVTRCTVAHRHAAAKKKQQRKAILWHVKDLGDRHLSLVQYLNFEL